MGFTHAECTTTEIHIPSSYYFSLTRLPRLALNSVKPMPDLELAIFLPQFLKYLGSQAYDTTTGLNEVLIFIQTSTEVIG